MTGRIYNVNSVYKIKFTKEALKALRKLPKKRQIQVSNVVNLLSQNPFVVPNVKPLSGTSYDDYRIRIGTLRLIYRIENDQLIITVLYLGSRGDVYKKI